MVTSCSAHNIYFVCTCNVEPQLIDIQRTLFLKVSTCSLFEGAAVHTCMYMRICKGNREGIVLYNNTFFFISLATLMLTYLQIDNFNSSGHCSLSDFAAKHSLSQVVSEPTRVTDNSATLIDHVYVSDVALLESCCSAPPLASSDHRSVLVSLSWSQAPVRKHRV